MRSETPPLDAASAAVGEALGRWDLGEVAGVESLPGGSSASPKFVVRSSRGTHVLKRRAPRASDAERIGFAHALIAASARVGVPVAAPVPSRNGAAFETVGGGAWELFPFVEGERWSRGDRQSAAAGEALGRMHRAGLDLLWHGHVVASSFHANLSVLEALRLAPASVLRVEPEADASALRRACESLGQAYREASAAVDEVGYASLDSQVVHGDFHPGNLLFRGDEVAAVIDFDAARIEPAVVDFANAVMQFSAVRGRARKLASWPAALDEGRLEAFTRAYARHGDPALRVQVDMVAPLMIEACVAEVSLPIARKGRFGQVKAAEMLQLVERRTAWLRRQGAQVGEWLRSALS
jgi:homoserine kinase type II